MKSGKLLYKFNATESGESLGVDNNGISYHFTFLLPVFMWLRLGERLALVTKDSTEVHMRIYDIKQKNGRRPIYSTVLRNFYGEISRAVFEPGGIYLALARNDNTTHVYDSRYLDRVLLEFAHEEGDTPLKEKFGVVEAHWATSFDTKRIGLLTGGNDGCVRLWDHRKSADDPSNGRVLVQMPADIAHFQIGDPCRGEAALVVYVFLSFEDLEQRLITFTAVMWVGMYPSTIVELNAAYILISTRYHKF